MARQFRIAAELRQEHALPGARVGGPRAGHDRGRRDAVRTGAGGGRRVIAQLYRLGLLLLAPITIAAALLPVALGLLYAVLLVPPIASSCGGAAARNCLR